MKKIFLITIVVILFTTVGILIFLNSNKANNSFNTNNPIEKGELEKIIKTFTIRFSSQPYDTEVEYDFVNKTKTIIHYTSDTWNHTDEIVEYNKFDKLFDYLYNTVFSNTDNLKYSSSGNYEGVDLVVSEPYFNMYVDFNTSEELPSFNNNWYSYINSKTDLASWGLNGYKLPSYWKDLLKILEIDKSILSNGTSYDFNKSNY